MQLGEKRLVVQLASQGTRPINPNAPAQVQVAGINLTMGAGPASEVLCLMNMVTADELKDDDEYEGMFECGRLQITQFRLQTSWRTLKRSALSTV